MGFSRCSRCHRIYLLSVYEDFCGECGRWLDERELVQYDERRVATIAEVAGWVQHGQREQPVRRWWCW